MVTTAAGRHDVTNGRVLLLRTERKASVGALRAGDIRCLFGVVGGNVYIYIIIQFDTAA
jgi:hypothetical protein